MGNLDTQWTLKESYKKQGAGNALLNLDILMFNATQLTAQASVPRATDGTPTAPYLYQVSSDPVLIIALIIAVMAMTIFARVVGVGRS